MNRAIALLLGLAVLFSGSAVAQTWESLQGPQVASTVRDINVTKSGTHVFVADGSYLLKSTNSGQGYAVTPVPYTAPLVALVKPDDSSKVVVAKNGELMYNDKGGAADEWLQAITDTTLIPLRLSAAVNDPSVMLLGRVWVTGRKSIWRSVDGGAGWTSVDGFTSQTDIHDFAPYPNDTSGHAAGLVWAAGSSDATPAPSFEKTATAEIRGLWISTNYGQTWPYNKLGGYNVSSVAIVSRTSSVMYHVYAAVSASGRDTLMKLTDHTNNDWTPVFSGADEIRMVRVNVSSTSIFLATNDGVYRSTDAYGTDGGGNWSKMTGLPENDVRRIAVGSGSTVFAGTSGSLYRSTDNGTTWTNVGDMDVSSVEAMHDGSGQVTWAVSRENNIAAKHNGSYWERRTLGAEGHPFSAERIYRNPHNGRLFVAGASGTTAGLYYSTNGGTSYVVPTFYYSIESGSRYYGIVAHPTNSNQLYMYGGGFVSGRWKVLFLSGDGGLTWAAADTVAGSGNASILDLVVSSTEPGVTMFAAMSDGNVYKSTNAGGYWGNPVLDAGSVARSIAVNRNQPTVVYVGSDSGLWKSTNSGDSWTNKRTDNIVRVMMHPSFQNSANRLWVIGNGGNSLYKTTNGGDTLNTVSSGATTPLRALGADLIRYGYSYLAGAGGVSRINEPPSVPVLQGTIPGNHPRLTWTALEESDLASPPYRVYKYYQECAYYCPAKNCGTGSTPQLACSTSASYWYDSSEDVLGCDGGGWGVEGLVKYYVIATDYIGVQVQTVTVPFNRGGFEQLPKSSIEEDLPFRYYLASNHPNPFNPVTVIRYGLAEDTRAVLVLYDVLGREVMRLCDEVQAAGEKSVRVDATALSSGVYFYRLTAGDFTAVRRMMVLK